MSTNQPTRPPVNVQGKLIAEPDGDGFLVMFPDGNVQFFHDKPAVEKAAKAFAETHSDPEAINALLIEWR